MAEMLIQSENLTAIADKIRVLSGTTNAMGLDAMGNYMNEANTNISTEANLIAQISSALESKGVSVEICRVAVGNASDIAYVSTAYENKQPYKWINGGGNTLVIPAAKGTIFCVKHQNSITTHNYTSGIELVLSLGNNIYAYYVKAEAAEMETITAD